jgi:endonuclease V-like protein UPF0215 family
MTIRSQRPKADFEKSEFPDASRQVQRGKNVRVHKKGIRALGIAESFAKGESRTSVLAGVVMRSDLIVDGFAFAETTVGGMDATQKVLQIYQTLERDDINVILLNGCVISWYNVIDLHEIAAKIKLPIICVTYDTSEGLEKYFKENFPDDFQARIEAYSRNGARKLFQLHTGATIYLRALNVNEKDALQVLDKFTLNGSVPEPLRIAGILARSLMKSTFRSASLQIA